MDSREQLLKSLMQDLQNQQVPELWDKAKQDQVMKGRKGQAEIDAGRAAIAENARAVREAEAQRGQLQERIRTLQGEIDAASTKAKQDDPVNQAIQYGKSVGIPLAGYGAGHVAGHAFGKGFDENSTERAAKVKTLADKLRGLNKASPTSRAETAAIVDTFDKGKLGRSGRSMTQFLGPLALGGASGLTQAAAANAEDPYLKEGLTLAANAERYGAVGMGLQQIIDTLRAKSPTDVGDLADVETARRALAEPPPPESPATPAKAPPKPGTRAALYAEAKARDLPVTTRTTKAELEKVMAKALKANATAAKRLRGIADKTSKNLVPLAVGYGVYDALRSPAEAADGGGGEPMSMAGAGAAAAGAGAGTAAGINKLRQVIGRIPGAAAAMGQANAALAPIGIDAMTDYAPEDVNMARNFAARHLPEALQFGAVKEAADMSQVPERNPLRTEASPGNQYYPLSSQPEAEPQLEPVIAMAEEDPEIANLLRELIMARAGTDQPATPMSAVASRLRSIGR